MIFRLPFDPVQSCIVTRAYLDVFERDYDLKVLPDDTVDGKGVWVIQAVRKRVGTAPPLKTVIYVRKDLPIVVRSVNYDRYGTKIQETHVHGIKLNVKVDPKHFTFKPDPEAQFIDLAAGR